MSTETWGMLPKNMEDPEKIEEAIDRLITAHKEDPEAHIQEGESLKTHRSQESIDHPLGTFIANSTVARRHNYHLLKTSFESIDTWDVHDSGQLGPVTHYINDVYLNTGSAVDNYVEFEVGSMTVWDRNKKFFFETGVYLKSLAESEIFLGTFALWPVDSENQSGVGFKIIDNLLYALILHSDNVSHKEKSIEIATLDSFTEYIFAVSYNHNNEIIFSLNGEDLYIEETQFLEIDSDHQFTYNLKTTNSSFKTMNIRHLVIGREI